LLATGIDAVEIDRIEGVLSRHGQRFLQRVYTPGEINHCKFRVPALAARFAAKEAISKALGTGMIGIRWRDIEVVSDNLGQPLVRLLGSAKERARDLGIEHVAISLTHSRELAIAVAVAEVREI